jgi:chromosome segregation ATPase
MKAVALFTALVAAKANNANPIEKIIEMISELEAKIIKEGEDAQKTYEEFSEWCEDSSKNLMFEIKTGKGEVASLKSTIEKESSNIQVQDSKIEELAGGISTDESDLKAATEIRNKEEATFRAEEKDLVETVDILERAIGIIEKEMNGGAAMVQLKQASTVTQVLGMMVQAESLSSADAHKLTALVQTVQRSDDDDSGAPDPAAYENQSGGVIDTMNDLLEKAQTQLDTLRAAEQKNVQNYEMLKQSLDDQIKNAKKEMDEAKTSKAASEEKKATAEGDLDVTSKDLGEDEKALGELHHNCMSTAGDFEAETSSRGEELKALATAKKIIKETTGGAAEQSYSFVQTSMSNTNSKVVRFIRQLAKKTRAPALAQLASRMASEIRFGSGSEADVFAKIKGLIADMIEKLEAEAEADATKKAYCDKELAETNQKKDDKTDEIEKLTAKIEQQMAQSAKLKEEVATLQAELAALTKEQAEMDKIRAEEKAAYEANSAEMEKGLNGIKMTLKVLNEYYAKADKGHSSSDGASSGIIGLLEVCESDFSKGLTEMNAAEEEAVSAYEQETKENEIEKTTKEQDVKYKTKEHTSLDKSVAENSSDKENVETELDAVNEYLKKVEEECIAKPESYEERKARREAEIAGLKEGLEVLESETALVQVSAKRTLRGAKRHF